MAARVNRRLFGMLSQRLDELGLDRIDDARDDRGKRWRLGTLLRATLGASVPSSDDWFAQRQTQGEDAALTGVVRTVTATLTSSAAKPIIDITPIPAHTNERGVFSLALDSLCRAYRGIELFKLVTYDAGACSAHTQHPPHC